MRTFLGIILSGLVFATGIFSPVQAAVIAPDTTFSRMSIDKTSVKADGIDSARISLTLRDSNLLPLDGAEVTLMSSRGAMDEIDVIEAFDRIAMKHYQKQQAKEQAKAKQKSTGKK
jgi:hypothetical protein